MSKKKIFLSVVALLVIAGVGYYGYELSKVRIEERLEGVGSTGVQNGQSVVFDYRGFLYDEKAPQNLGREFDSSYKRHEPMKAVVGAKQVIPGLDKALLGMKPGGQRKVTIAPSMGYGATGAGDGLVPPNSKLVYIIELRSIQL